MYVSRDGITEDYREDPEYYCVSIIKNHKTTNVSAIACIPDEPLEEIILEKHNIIYSSLLFIGAIFLLATFLVYAMLPELRRAVQGLSLMSHCACMLVAHIATIYVKLEGHRMDDVACYITAYLIQFSFLSGFFWMNVICVDIASKFRSLQSMVPNTSCEMRKFGLYAIYAMGCPFLMFILTISLNNIHDKLDPYIRPGLGDLRCWFGDDAKTSIAIFLYFYLPIGLLILFNSILFVFTALKIFILTRETQSVTRSRNNDKTSFILFIKLFILMGLPWLTEIISWRVGGNIEIWYFTDSLNILRSVFIFILFCCKSRVWDLLKSKFSSRSAVQTYSMRNRSEHSTVSSNYTNSCTVESTLAEETIKLDNDRVTFTNKNYK